MTGKKKKEKRRRKRKGRGQPSFQKGKSVLMPDLRGIKLLSVDPTAQTRVSAIRTPTEALTTLAKVFSQERTRSFDHL